ncbi:MAG: phage tail protein [Scytonematopsis contorta HA4267-MV1]|nr:phage tail protein [Scytonematopsis contorta HA4267-MV1]
MSLLPNLLGQQNQSNQFYGLTIGIVTNNKDEEGLARVKVKFPLLSDNDESFWARVVTPMAGEKCGIYFLPEVGSEVLIAFAHGNVASPYILGSLWNGVDKPPEFNSDGKNDKRIIKSRSGHTILLDDTPDSEKIEVIDKSLKNSIVINTKDNSISITADADISINSQNGKLKLSAQSIEINSQAGMKITAQQNMDLQAGPVMNIKGNMVNIN